MVKVSKKILGGRTNGLSLLKSGGKNNDEKLKMYFLLPKVKITKLLQHFQNVTNDGHLDINKTLTKIKVLFYDDDVEDFCQRYQIC